MNTCRRRNYTETENHARWSIQGSNEYTQKKILQRNRKQRSHNTISEKDFRDLTIINRQRKRAGVDRSLPKVKLCRNHPKGRSCSPPKRRTREVVLRSKMSKGQTRAGRGSVLRKGCEEGLQKFQRSNWTWKRKGKSLGKEGLDANRLGKYVALVWLKLEVALVGAGIS